MKYPRKTVITLLSIVAIALVYVFAVVCSKNADDLRMLDDATEKLQNASADELRLRRILGR